MKRRTRIVSKVAQALIQAGTAMDRSEEDMARHCIRQGIVSPYNFLSMDGCMIITVNGACEYLRAVLDGREPGDSKEAAHWLDQLAIRNHWQEPVSQREAALQTYAMVLADIVPGDKQAAAMAIHYMTLDFPMSEEELEAESQSESESQPNQPNHENEEY